MLCKMNVGSGQGEGSLRGVTLGDMIKPATLVSVGESAMHSKQQCLMLVLPCLLGAGSAGRGRCVTAPPLLPGAGTAHARNCGTGAGPAAVLCQRRGARRLVQVGRHSCNECISRSMPRRGHAKRRVDAHIRCCCACGSSCTSENQARWWHITVAACLTPPFPLRFNCRYNQREGRSLLEVLQDFKSCTPPLEWLLEAAPLLKPRQFSISSSPRWATLHGQGADAGQDQRVMWPMADLFAPVLQSQSAQPVRQAPESTQLDIASTASTAMPLLVTSLAPPWLCLPWPAGCTQATHT